MREFVLQGKAQDNFGYNYTVSIKEQPIRESSLTDWVFRIHDTSGSWYISTLETNPLRESIYIDMGQNWLCTNIKPLLAEAQELLSGIPRAPVQGW